MTKATFDNVTLSAGVNIGPKFNVWLLMDIVLCRLVRYNTTSLLSSDARLSAMYLIDLGPISFDRKAKRRSRGYGEGEEGIDDK